MIKGAFDIYGAVPTKICVNAIVELFTLCRDSILAANIAAIAYDNEGITKSAYLCKHRKALKYIRIIEELGLKDLYIYWRDER